MLLIIKEQLYQRINTKLAYNFKSNPRYIHNSFHLWLCHRSLWELPIIFQRTFHYIILKTPGMLSGGGRGIVERTSVHLLILKSLGWTIEISQLPGNSGKDDEVRWGITFWREKSVQWVVASSPLSQFLYLSFWSHTTWNQSQTWQWIVWHSEW